MITCQRNNTSRISCLKYSLKKKDVALKSADTKTWKCVIPVVFGKQGRLCSQTQLYQLRCFNDYTRQLHVSAPTGHLKFS